MLARGVLGVATCIVVEVPEERELNCFAAAGARAVKCTVAGASSRLVAVQRVIAVAAGVDRGAAGGDRAANFG